MGHSIFNKTPTQDSGHTLIDYALPSEISQHFDTALSLHHIPVESVHHLDADSINDTKMIAFVRLFKSPEVQLTADACHALGHRGVLGHM